MNHINAHVINYKASLGPCYSQLTIKWLLESLQGIGVLHYSGKIHFTISAFPMTEGVGTSKVFNYEVSWLFPLK